MLALSPGFTNREMLEGVDFSHTPIKPMPVKPVVASALQALEPYPEARNAVSKTLGTLSNGRSNST